MWLTEIASGVFAVYLRSAGGQPQLLTITRLEDLPVKNLYGGNYPDKE